jgi:hypothetical protein
MLTERARSAVSEIYRLPLLTIASASACFTGLLTDFIWVVTHHGTCAPCIEQIQSVQTGGYGNCSMTHYGDLRKIVDQFGVLRIPTTPPSLV